MRRLYVAGCLAALALAALGAAAASPGARPSGSNAPSLIATADAHVVKANPRHNYGRVNELRVGSSPLSATYLRFRLRPGTRFSRAVLQLYTKSRSRSGFIVHRVADNRWRERTLTFANAPVAQARVGSSGAFKRGVWTGIDVTRVARGQRFLSLALTSSSQSVIRLASRESPRFAPRLLLQLPQSDQTRTLVAAGSIASCEATTDEVTAALVERIPGTVAPLGDLAYESGTYDQFQRCYGPSWGRFKARTRPAPGNREYMTPRAAGYFRYFGAAAGDPGRGYYSYDLGAWHIVVLNSECDAVGGCGPGSAQERWLRQDLADHAATCTLAYWHHPLFSSTIGPEEERPTKPLWTALYRAGAEIVLNGHGRNYERFAPQTPNGVADPVRGIRQFIVSTGGIGHRAPGLPRANSEVRNDDTFGVLKLTLRANGYDWQFVPEVGKTFSDSGSGTCH